MVDYSDDSDEELGAYIYSTSRIALREEAAARNNELSLNNDNDITRYSVDNEKWY